MPRTFKKIFEFRGAFETTKMSQHLDKLEGFFDNSGLTYEKGNQSRYFE
jgi:hypothetical protein